MKPYLRIPAAEFYRVADLQQLKAAKYRAIAERLLDDYSLILGRGRDFFTLVPAAACGGWTELRRSAVTAELKRRPPQPVDANRTVGLSPQAAWPFPTGGEAKP